MVWTRELRESLLDKFVEFIRDEVFAILISFQFCSMWNFNLKILTFLVCNALNLNIIIIKVWLECVTAFTRIVLTSLLYMYIYPSKSF